MPVDLSSYIPFHFNYILFSTIPNHHISFQQPIELGEPKKSWRDALPLVSSGPSPRFACVESQTDIDSIRVVYSSVKRRWPDSLKHMEMRVVVPKFKRGAEHSIVSKYSVPTRFAAISRLRQPRHTKLLGDITHSAINKIIHDHDQLIGRQLGQRVGTHPRHGLAVTDGLGAQQPGIARRGRDGAEPDLDAQIRRRGLALDVGEGLAALLRGRDGVERRDDAVARERRVRRVRVDVVVVDVLQHDQALALRARLVDAFRAHVRQRAGLQCPRRRFECGGDGVAQVRRRGSRAFRRHAVPA